jgi:hypothetical protein
MFYSMFPAQTAEENGKGKFKKLKVQRIKGLRNESLLPEGTCLSRVPYISDCRETGRSSAISYFP